MEWFVSGDENTILGDTGLLLDDVTDAAIFRSMILNNVRLGNLNLCLRGPLTSQVDHCKHDNAKDNVAATRGINFRTDVLRGSRSSDCYAAIWSAIRWQPLNEKSSVRESPILCRQRTAKHCRCRRCLMNACGILQRNGWKR